ncbi:hypothetical protein ACH4E7_10110 [Kitasatospora sp. NPDC018058]|uniref:hypothetical protein n=1 Tax=Kitasatospora sp. NPDC018058 TaxID=3364025 RepID=UPI0037C13F21
MSISLRAISRRRAMAAVGAATVLALTLSACGSTDHSSMPGMNHGAATSSASATGGTHGMDGMDGMDHGAVSGDGLAAEKDGYRLDSRTTTVPASQADPYAFTITGPDGKPVTDFTVEQTKLMHFYAIRSDLTGYQHLHPTMAADGTWTADLAALTPGTWRLYASFTPGSGSGKGQDFVLSRTVTVPGNAAPTPLPAASTTTTVDGYTVTVQGEPMAGMAHPLTVTFAKDGQPVTDLQPYLDTYAHISAFHEGDQSLAHLHPETPVNGDHGGPNLSFHAQLAKSGNWRVFLQFQTGGQLHTAELTLRVS